MFLGYCNNIGVSSSKTFQQAVTNDELYGIINPATREWKDGLFSVIMRDQVKA